MDHAEAAEHILVYSDGLILGDHKLMVSSALAHSMLALCERLDNLSCLIAIPVEDDDEDEE